MIRPRQKKIGGKVIFLIMFRMNTKIRRTSREDACLSLRGESMMQHLHHHRTHTMPLMATLGISQSNTRLILSLSRTTSHTSRTLIPSHSSWDRATRHHKHATSAYTVAGEHEQHAWGDARIRDTNVWRPLLLLWANGCRLPATSTTSVTEVEPAWGRTPLR
jgi:hypothetical protein